MTVWSIVYPFRGTVQARYLCRAWQYPNNHKMPNRSKKMASIRLFQMAKWVKLLIPWKPANNRRQKQWLTVLMFQLKRTHCWSKKKSTQLVVLPDTNPPGKRAKCASSTWNRSRLSWTVSIKQTKKTWTMKRINRRNMQCNLRPQLHSWKRHHWSCHTRKNASSSPPQEVVWFCVYQLSLIYSWYLHLQYKSGQIRPTPKAWILKILQPVIGGK